MHSRGSTAAAVLASLALAAPAAAAPSDTYVVRNLVSSNTDLVPADLDFDQLVCPVLDATVKVLNQGCLGVGPGVDVAFYDAGTLIGVVQTENAIPAGGSETVGLMAEDLMNPPYDLTVVVDDDGMGMGAFNECDEENNESAPLEACIPVG